MKKRYKLKKKNLIILLSVVLILFILLFGKATVNVFHLMLIDYNFGDSVSIYKRGIYDKVIEKGYSDTIANIIDSDEFVLENLELYYEIDFLEKDNFLSNVNDFLKEGYTTKEINIINKENDDVLNSYLVKNYVPNVNKWVEYDFFKADKFERYLNYFDGDYKNTIVSVNIGLDKEYYQDVKVIKDYSVDVLANKYNKLDSSFLPNNLTKLDKCSGSGHYLSIDAKNAYDKLCEAALNEGMSISVNSSYRSYKDQEDVYNSYLKLYGQSYVDKYVAVAGYSEHQTGLALDVKSLKSDIFKNSDEYKWMVDNSYKYGFILRYPENKKDITGYNSEAWHFRYVGVEAATYIYENNITYDEYYVMFLDN